MPIEILETALPSRNGNLRFFVRCTLCDDRYWTSEKPSKLKKREGCAACGQRRRAARDKPA